MSTVEAEGLVTAGEGAAGPPSPPGQPLIGLAGVVWVGGVFALLGLLPGAQTAVQTVGPVTTFMLPVLILIAVWWQGWPGNGSSRLLGGIINTVVLGVLAIVLMMIAQVIVGKGDLHGLFIQAIPPNLTKGHFTSFPWLVPLAALIFVTMLQLTFVNERLPLAALGRAGGVVALVISWGVGLLAYYLFTQWNFLLPPPPAGPAIQHLIGLHNPGGPITGVNPLHIVDWAVCLAMWQAILFILLRGMPFVGIRGTVPRLLVQNILTLAVAWGTYFLFKDVFDWSIERIAAVCGTAIGGIFVATMLTEGWVARFGGPGAVVLAAVAVTLGLFFGLRGLGNLVDAHWKVVPVELWVGLAGLNWIAAIIIAHYALWRRWPFPPPAPPPPPPAQSAVA